MSEKISVIVPVYNVEKYIGKCIKSITNQDYENIEIILVDDGSKDQAGKICDDYALKDKRIRVIHKKNGGVSSARNIGIESSTGEYIAFVDGDDYVEKDYISYLLSLIKNNSADVSLSMSYFTDYQKKQTENDKTKVITGKEAAIQIMSYNIAIGVYNKLFSKSAIIGKVKFDEDLCMGEGFNFNTDVFQRVEKVAIGYRKIYFYRKNNSESVTTKFDAQKWKNGLLAIEKIKNKLVIKDREMVNAWKFANWRTHVDIYNLLIATKNEKNYNELYKKCLKEGKKNWKYAFKNPTARREKIRAISMIIFPRILPFVYNLRKRIFVKG